MVRLVVFLCLIISATALAQRTISLLAPAPLSLIRSGMGSSYHVFSYPSAVGIDNFNSVSFSFHPPFVHYPASFRAAVAKNYEYNGFSLGVKYRSDIQQVRGGFYNRYRKSIFGATLGLEAKNGDVTLGVSPAVSFVHSSGSVFSARIENVLSSKMDQPYNPHLSFLHSSALKNHHFLGVQTGTTFQNAYENASFDLFYQKEFHFTLIVTYFAHSRMVPSAGIDSTFLTTGLGFQMKMQQSSLRFFAGITTDIGLRSNTAQFSVSFVPRFFSDTQPPQNSLSVSDSVINHYVGNKIIFYPQCFDQQSEVISWLIAIGKSVQSQATLQGRGVPPRTVSWDGRDDSAKRVAPGSYVARLICKDSKGNVSTSTQQRILVTETKEF